MGLLKLVNSEEHLSNETSKKQKKQSNKQHVSIINKLKPKNVRKLWKTWYANYKNKMKKNNDFRKKMKGEEKKTRLMRQTRSEEHTSELQSRGHLVCRLLREKKKSKQHTTKTEEKRTDASKTVRLI